MCGIVAVVGNTPSAELRKSSLGRMAKRGPDAEGNWASQAGPVWLGHRRLAIVDLSEAGRQPMTNEDQSLWLVCNGEIYNSPKLRRELVAKGHRFHSRSDNEVILHAYEVWGDACVERLEGMYAFALWDEKRRRLLAARDPVGIKPLHYAFQGDGLVLASDCNAILPLFRERPRPDPVALAQVMTLGYVPAPGTIWIGIQKLEPGHALTWSAETGVKIRRHWEPPRSLDESPCEVQARWPELFSEVLSEHLISDVPVGLFLSGGIDSSTLAVGLSDLGQPLQAITVGFPDSPADETPIASAVAGHLNLPHLSEPLQVSHVDELLQDVTRAFDEPQGYSALLSMLLVSRVAAERFKVVLSGDGGDEVFGGYTWHRDLRGGKSRLSGLLRRSLRARVRSGASARARQWAMRSFAGTSTLHRHAMRVFPRFLPEEAEALMDPMGLRFDDDQMLESLRRHFLPELPLRRALQRVDLMTFCSGSILPKVDRASMAHSLEVRVPLLDRRVIEWGLSRPERPDESTEGKFVLRDFLKGRVPPAVLTHPKQGFSLRALQDFNYDAALDRVREGHWVREGMWSPAWSELTAPGVPYRNARIWVLLVLTLWAEAHLS